LADLSAFDTDDLAEGGNQYFTIERAQDAVASALVAGTNITIFYNDALGTITIDAAGGGGDVQIQEEGVTVDPTATNLNFVGDTITASSASAGNVNVTVDAQVPITVSDGVSSVANPPTITFIGGATVFDAGGSAVVTAAQPSQAQQDDVTVTSPANIFNFTGSGVTVTDDPDAGKVNIDIPGGSGGGTDVATVTAIAAGSTLALEQSLLAQAGQPGLTVLAVAFTTSGKVMGVSLGDGNVVEVYANGSDFNNGVVLYREFMSRGEPIIFPGLQNGSIITASQGFYGFSEQVEGNAESPMPLMSFGLAFTSTFFFAFRNSQNFDPTGTQTSQGWIHVVNGPLESTVRLTDGNGVTVQGQENVVLTPWQYFRFFTDGNQEYQLISDNPIMAAINANMDNNPFGAFYDSRLILPLTNDGITWPRSGFLSAPFNNTQVRFFVRDGAEGELGTGSGVSWNPRCDQREHCRLQEVSPICRLLVV
ncbi:MAG: hypothetical protein AAF840_16345, partial [Bacteroidota bacterium]